MNDINITIGNGGLGRNIVNYDVISGLALYTTLKEQADFDAAGITDLSATDRINVYYSLDQFELDTNITFNNAATQAIWYQVKEYFRIAPKGILYVGLFYDTNVELTPIPLTYSELKDMQVYSDGIIRQIGVWAQYSALLITEVEKVQGIADELFTLHMPTYFIYGADSSGIQLTNLTDMRTANSKNVSVTILQDGANYGASLFNTLGMSIPAVGTLLGVTSEAKVNESVAWVQKFNIAGSGEFDEPAFGNGELYKDSLAYVDAINDKGYIFGYKHVGIVGTYFNENSTCDVITSDYAYMSEVRTINKAIRNVRSVMLPYLNSPIKLDSKTGQIDKLVIVNWTNVMSNELSKMVRDGEVSNYSVYIDPNQNVILTSTVDVTIKLVPYGTARNINITIGYTVTI